MFCQFNKTHWIEHIKKYNLINNVSSNLVVCDCVMYV